MTTVPSRSPTDTRSQTQRPRPTTTPAGAITLDPIRVLRQHAVLLVASVFIGCGVGIVAHFAFDAAYPLYSERVLFELVPAPEGVSEVIVRDERTEEAVERLGQTEAARIISRDLLEKALSSRDVEQTKWSEGYRDENGRFIPANAVDDLRDSVRLRQMVARDFEQIQASVGEMLVDRPRRNILRRGNVGGAA